MAIIRIKRGIKVGNPNFPTWGYDGQLIYATDTNELFMGKGEGNPLELVSAENRAVLDLLTDNGGTIEYNGQPIAGNVGYAKMGIDY